MPAKRKGTAAAIAAAIIASVFAIEGGYVNNRKDPGGATIHGVTEAVARTHGYTGDMREMSQEFAGDIYYTDYIEKPGYVPMLVLAPAVAEELVDSAVNAGPGRSSRWFQQSLNALNREGADYPDLVVDGRVGPGTIAAYEKLANKRGKVKACQMILKLLDAHQAMHYVSLGHLEAFTPGWVDHRLGNVPLSKCEA